MRKHGIADFPDPDNQGSFNLSATNIDEYSQSVLAAGKICLPAADGAIKPPSSNSSASGSQQAPPRDPVARARGRAPGYTTISNLWADGWSAAGRAGPDRGLRPRIR